MTTEKLTAFLDAFASEVEAAQRHHERPTGGQQVPFHGDFANLLPSTRAKLNWWARAAREVLSGNFSRVLRYARNEGIEKAATEAVEALIEAGEDPRAADSLALRLRGLKEDESEEPDEEKRLRALFAAQASQAAYSQVFTIWGDAARAKQVAEEVEKALLYPDSAE